MSTVLSLNIYKIANLQCISQISQIKTHKVSTRIKNQQIFFGMYIICVEFFSLSSLIYINTHQNTYVVNTSVTKLKARTCHKKWLVMALCLSKACRMNQQF